MGLHDLKPPRGMKHAKKRIGRGHGSGHGKTASRGHKGAKSRSGFKFKRGFEGGQMPLHRRVPKRGFHNPFRVEYEVVNLDQLPAKTDLINAQPPACDLVQDPDLVLHYLKHGSLPENASGLSFHALRQLAGRLTEEQMASVAQVAVPWFAGGREIARRTAILLSPPLPFLEKR